MNVSIWVEVHSYRRAHVAWAVLRVTLMVVTTWLGVTAYVACCVGINERFDTVLNVAVRYLGFLSSFSNFYRLNIHVRWSLLKLNLARLSIWRHHGTYLKIICSMNILLFRWWWIRIPMADVRTHHYLRPCKIFSSGSLTWSRIDISLEFWKYGVSSV